MESVARAKAKDLVLNIEHLNNGVANQLISAAKVSKNLVISVRKLDLFPRKLLGAHFSFFFLFFLLKGTYFGET